MVLKCLDWFVIFLGGPAPPIISVTTGFNSRLWVGAGNHSARVRYLQGYTKGSHMSSHHIPTIENMGYVDGSGIW